MEVIGNAPDYAPFYLARASFLKEFKAIDPITDLTKAQQLNPNDWRTAQALTQYYVTKKEINNALIWAKKSHLQFPDNYALGMDYAAALNEAKTIYRKHQYPKSIKSAAL